jgi:hypothetical protein
MHRTARTRANKFLGTCTNAGLLALSLATPPHVRETPPLGQERQVGERWVKIIREQHRS